MVRIPHSQIPVALTIAGSDSGGGAGIQADLKTFFALNVFGTSAVTCVTAQNPDRVSGITAVDAGMVSLQIRTICDGFPVVAAKTGMLYAAPIVLAISKTVAECGIATLVVDPVIFATSGTRLLQDDAVGLLCSDLMPQATVITPNVPEAAMFCGRDVRSLADSEAAAREIGKKFGAACVVKGGHMEGKEIADVLYSNGEVTVFTLPRVDAVETHGTGCTFSAALTAFLARGESIKEAVEHAGKFVAEALKNAVRAGTHRPLRPIGVKLRMF